MANSEISQLIDDGNFEQAYCELISCIAKTSLSPEMLTLSSRLSKEVRYKCLLLSSNKATDGSPEVFKLEALLREIIKINGEGFYG